MQCSDRTDEVVVIGAGPAGLMAASVLADAGVTVRVVDGSALAGRKFLLAGKGGLNLTHSEPAPGFVARYGQRSAVMAHVLDAFGPDAVRTWAADLGIDTFVGSSGRVFPIDMKAAPLLRAWLHRLRAQGVRFCMHHRWTGFDEHGLFCFSTPTGEQRWRCPTVVLALGGASWSRLGSDGAWVHWLTQRGVPVSALRPSNCGFDVASRGRAGWTPYFGERFAGQPFKSVVLRCEAGGEILFQRKGEFVATASGIEGSLVYAASAVLRNAIEDHGQVAISIDLLPDRSAMQVLAEVAHPRGSRSLSSHLKSRLGLDGIKAGLLHEVLTPEQWARPESLASAIKAVPLILTAARPIDEAISTAGGVPFEEMNEDLMLRALPGTFCAGEMLDWEAPTGGYLLTACLATGRRAGEGALRWWNRPGAGLAHGPTNGLGRFTPAKAV